MKLEIHYDDGFAGLYVDGVLDRVGESYVVEERAFELLGVGTVQDDAFMLGQKQRDGVARTLEQVKAYADARQARFVEAQHMRQQAELLLKQADQLEGQSP